MKMFRMIPRYFRDAFKSVIRNFNLSFASMLCIFITLMLVSLSIILSKNVEQFTNVVKDDFTIIAFMNEEITKEDLSLAEEQILSLDNIKSVDLYTKLQKKKELSSQSEVYENIVSSWPDDDIPLYDEFLIKVKNVDNISDTAQKIEKVLNVESVKYGEGMVEQLVNIFNTVKRSTIIAVIALVLLTSILITNTIKLTIVSRRKEIEIMRLVGASNITIKLPFLIEGLILGLLGSLLPVAVTVYGYNALFQYLDGKMFTTMFELVPPTPFLYSISLILFVIGGLVGMFGSGNAVRKYLKI